MFLRWQSRKRKRSQFGDWRSGDTHWSAIIAESARLNGKPAQRHIAYLVGFTESQASIAAQRCHLWDHIAARLDGLANQITAVDRKRFEAAIATKVPRPSRADYKAAARRAAPRNSGPLGRPIKRTPQR